MSTKFSQQWDISSHWAGLGLKGCWALSSRICICCEFHHSGVTRPSNALKTFIQNDFDSKRNHHTLFFCSYPYLLLAGVLLATDWSRQADPLKTISFVIHAEVSIECELTDGEVERPKRMLQSVLPFPKMLMRHSNWGGKRGEISPKVHIQSPKLRRALEGKCSGKAKLRFSARSLALAAWSMERGACWLRNGNKNLAIIHMQYIRES